MQRCPVNSMNYVNRSICDSNVVIVVSTWYEEQTQLNVVRLPHTSSYCFSVMRDIQLVKKSFSSSPQRFTSLGTALLTYLITNLNASSPFPATSSTCNFQRLRLQRCHLQPEIFLAVLLQECSENERICLCESGACYRRVALFIVQFIFPVLFQYLYGTCKFWNK